MKPKLLRVTTIPESLKILLKGQHKFISENGFEVIGVSSSGIALDEVCKDEEVRVIEIEMTRKITLINDLFSVYNLYKIIRKEKPTIVHSHTPKAGIVAMLAAKLANVPIRLHTVAGLPLMESKGFKRKLLNFVEKTTYYCATKVYPNSKGLYDFILAQNYTIKKKLHVIANGSSNGIDTSFFNPELIDVNLKQDLKQQFGIKENDFVFIFVGRLVGDKGINELIEAFSKLNDCNVKLLLVGWAEPDLDPLKKNTIDEINRNQNIISVGFQTDVRVYFAISQCLVFPSYREGFPNVVMQSGSMGLPSIVSNINGCNEIIKDGVNGLLIPPKDIMALQNAMINLIEDKKVYNNLKNNARQMITSSFEQKLVWETLLLEYQDLLVSSKI
jgi:glycosyltransferase involved in cell wall biosynthesis